VGLSKRFHVQSWVLTGLIQFKHFPGALNTSKHVMEAGAERLLGGILTDGTRNERAAIGLE